MLNRVEVERKNSVSTALLKATRPTGVRSGDYVKGVEPRTILISGANSGIKYAPNVRLLAMGQKFMKPRIDCFESNFMISIQIHLLISLKYLLTGAIKIFLKLDIYYLRIEVTKIVQNCLHVLNKLFYDNIVYPANHRPKPTLNLGWFRSELGRARSDDLNQP